MSARTSTVGRIVPCLFVVVALAACGSLQPDDHGNAADFDPSRDYYREGMDAGAAHDYQTAAEMLGYAYVQAPDAYRLFWYLNWLSYANRWEEIDAVASAAPAEDLYHAAYHSGSYRVWARALVEMGNVEAAVEVLIAGYDRDPATGAAIARELVYDPWNQDGAAVGFLYHPRHEELLRDIAGRTVNEWEPDPTLARHLYHHLVVSIARSIEHGDHAGDRAIASLLVDFDAVAEHAIALGADPRLINHANYRVLREALRFAWERPPFAGPGRARLLNLYVPSVRASAGQQEGDVAVSYSTAYIERRIASLVEQARVCGLVYWYLTDGRLYPEFEFQILEGAAATALNERGTAIEIASVSPYPAELLYDRYRQYAGVLWWFPSFDGVLYLSGPRALYFVPRLLQSARWRMVSTMPSAASYAVLIHELFHNVGAVIGVDSGHTYIEDNEAIWPAWYRDSVAANGGQIAEYAWYAGLLCDYVAVTESPFEKILDTEHDWMPTDDAFARARQTFGEMGFARVESVHHMVVEANELIRVGDVDAGVALLRRATSLAPDAAPAHFALAYVTHWRLEDREGAQALYDTFLERFPGLPESNVALIYAMSWYTTRDPSHALALYARHGGNAVDDDQYSGIELLRVKSLARAGMIASARTVAEGLLAEERFTLTDDLCAFLQSVE